MLPLIIIGVCLLAVMASGLFCVWRELRLLRTGTAGLFFEQRRREKARRKRITPL